MAVRSMALPPSQIQPIRSLVCGVAQKIVFVDETQNGVDDGLLWNLSRKLGEQHLVEHSGCRHDSKKSLVRSPLPADTQRFGDGTESAVIADNSLAYADIWNGNTVLATGTGLSSSGVLRSIPKWHGSRKFPSFTKYGKTKSLIGSIYHHRNMKKFATTCAVTTNGIRGLWKKTTDLSPRHPSCRIWCGALTHRKVNGESGGEIASSGDISCC